MQRYQKLGRDYGSCHVRNKKATAAGAAASAAGFGSMMLNATGVVQAVRRTTPKASTTSVDAGADQAKKPFLARRPRNTGEELEDEAEKSSTSTTSTHSDHRKRPFLARRGQTAPSDSTSAAPAEVDVDGNVEVLAPSNRREGESANFLQKTLHRSTASSSEADEDQKLRKWVSDLARDKEYVRKIHVATEKLLDAVYFFEAASSAIIREIPAVEEKAGPHEAVPSLNDLETWLDKARQELKSEISKVSEPLAALETLLGQLSLDVFGAQQDEQSGERSVWGTGFPTLAFTRSTLWGPLRVQGETTAADFRKWLGDVHQMLNEFWSDHPVGSQHESARDNFISSLAHVADAADPVAGRAPGVVLVHIFKPIAHSNCESHDTTFPNDQFRCYSVLIMRSVLRGEVHFNRFHLPRSCSGRGKIGAAPRY
ncbi:unnamed protein product [Amoebophrya sp. A120]|nr:unnamed protein product [Amoebophrya sp. A120]|eukprot:GSA120T00009973001.1